MNDKKILCRPIGQEKQIMDSLKAFITKSIEESLEMSTIPAGMNAEEWSAFLAVQTKKFDEFQELEMKKREEYEITIEALKNKYSEEYVLPKNEKEFLEFVREFLKDIPNAKINECSKKDAMQQDIIIGEEYNYALYMRDYENFIALYRVSFEGDSTWLRC